MPWIEYGNAWAASWGACMVRGLIDSTAVFLLISGLWRLLRNRCSPQFGYFLFVIVLVKLALPGPISVPALLLSLIPAPLETHVEKWIAPGAANPRPDRALPESTAPPSGSAPSAGNPENPPAPPQLTAAAWLMLGWLLALPLLSARWMWTVRRIHSLLGRTQPLEEKQLPLDLRALQQTAGVRQPIRWVTAPWIKSPVTYGVLRPVVLVPPGMFTRFTLNQVRWILLHELAHIRRVDAVVLLLQRILHIVFFFHPVVWWTNAQIDLLREYACDDAALSNSRVPRGDCGEGFLSMIRQENALPVFLPATLGLVDYRTLIRRRLMRILDGEREVRACLSPGAAAALLGIAFGLAPFSAWTALAQAARWTQLAVRSQDAPGPRAAAGMAYDARRGVAVLHGGLDWDQLLPDTWEFDGTSWTRTAESGPARCCAGMAYDPARGVTVLEGGYNTSTMTFNRRTYGASTWEWDGRQWREAGFGDPRPRAWVALVYCPALRCVIRHGGVDGNPNGPSAAFLGDTSRWDGSRWIPIADGPVRAGHQMVYDSARQRVVLFGGIGAPDLYPDDTWEFDGTQWTQAATSGPPGRHWFGFAFDGSRGVAVLYGGNRWMGYYDRDIWLGDTWEWDGREWRKTSQAGPGRAYSPAMVYDSRHGKIILFLPGGRGTGTAAVERDTPNLEILRETWEYAAVPRGTAFIRWPVF